MTNLDRWLLYCKDFVSPDSYIRFGFYYMINAALQRRVWLGNDSMPIYPNMYIIPTGEAGVGKGLVTSQVAKALTHFRLELPKNRISIADVTQAKDADLAGSDAIRELAKAQGERKPPASLLTIPVASDSISYEALVLALSRSLRTHTYKVESKLKFYGHCSLCFCLEEISSLFRKHMEQVSKFLLVTYDCRDYKNETIGRGVDEVKNSCVSLLGGTTPSFMRKAFSDELLSDGFASRCLFLFEEKNRFNRLFIADFSNEQLAAHKELLEHIHKLTRLYGRATLTEEAEEYMASWWDKQHNRNNRVNPSMKLDAFYARGNQHIVKLAMAVHFSEKTDMLITLDEVKEAQHWLEFAILSMHKALTFGTKNPLAELTRQIERVFAVNVNGIKKNDLVIDFFDACPSGVDDIDRVLAFLLQAKRITYDRASGHYRSILREPEPSSDD